MTGSTDTCGPISNARFKIEQAHRIVALTGAGVSAESGVPTFRGDQGLWKTYKPEDLATPEAFERQPEIVWEWYNWRRALIADAKPNPAHTALAALEQRTRKAFQLLTQNVDGLHHRSGSRQVVELHGSIWWLRCTICGHSTEDRTVPLPPLPRCGDCGGLLRPDVVWFGEALDPTLLDKAVRAASTAEIMLVVGTSAVVQPAASLAWLAKRNGAWIIEINRVRTPLSDIADTVLLGAAGDIMPGLVDHP